MAIDTSIFRRRKLQARKQDNAETLGTRESIFGRLNGRKIQAKLQV
jgi:hypothetical protein